MKNIDNELTEFKESTYKKLDFKGNKIEKMDEILELLEDPSNAKEGIYISGRWGSGKSLFLKGLKEIFEEERKNDEKKILIIDTWKLSHLETLESMIFYSIIDDGTLSKVLGKEGKIQGIKEGASGKVKDLARTLDKKISGGIVFWLSDIFSDKNTIFEDNNELTEIEIFYDFIKKKLNIDYIILDELDRCIPTVSVELIRRITFHNQFNSKKDRPLFISSGNHDELVMVLKHIYGLGYSAEAYFEKIYNHEIKITGTNKDKMQQLNTLFRSAKMNVHANAIDMEEMYEGTVLSLSSFRTIDKLTTNKKNKLFYRYYGYIQHYISEVPSQYRIVTGTEKDMILLTFYLLIEIELLREIDNISFVKITDNPNREDFDNIANKYFSIYVTYFKKKNKVEEFYDEYIKFNKALIDNVRSDIFIPFY